MLNMQPREPIVRHDGLTLDIIDIFETLQGEGPFAGCRSTFVRLAGCTQRCIGCDTNYTEGRKIVPLASVLFAINMIREKSLVVLTGGEPLRQNIGPLVDALDTAGHVVQIETSGTAWQDEVSYHKCCIVLSPKAPKVHPKLETVANFWKYVVCAGSVGDDGLPLDVLGDESIVPARPPRGVESGYIYLQPFDNGTDEGVWANLKAAAASCLKHGYRLGCQLHKLSGLP